MRQNDAKTIKRPSQKAIFEWLERSKGNFFKIFFIDFHFITTNMRKNDTK